MAARRLASSAPEAVAAGEEGEPPLMLDDAIVVLGETELLERVGERALRGDQQGADVELGTLRGVVRGVHGSDLACRMPRGQAIAMLRRRHRHVAQRWGRHED